METKQPYLVEASTTRQGGMWTAAVYNAQGAYIGTANVWVKGNLNASVEAVIARHECKPQRRALR